MTEDQMVSVEVSQGLLDQIKAEYEAKAQPGQAETVTYHQLVTAAVLTLREWIRGRLIPLDVFTDAEKAVLGSEQDNGGLQA